jgi:hypothetical protein
LEAGFATAFTNYEFLHGDFAGNDVTHIDTATGVVWGSDSCETFVKAHKSIGSAIIAWVPPNWLGSHSIRTGVSLSPAYRSDFGPTGTLDGPDAAWAWRYSNGVPASIVIFNTPYTQKQTWFEQGYFIQDSWTIKNRLTLNLGVRVERLVGNIPAGDNPAGPWVPARQWDEIPNTPNWTTVVPRLGAVYALTDSGKTAVKVNYSKYQQKVGASWMRDVNPSSRGSSTVPWSAPATGPCSPTASSTCAVPVLSEIDFTKATPFTGGVNVRYAPGVKRPYQWETSASLQHELMPNVGVSVTYYHRRYHDLTGTANVLVPPSAYGPVTITNPLTSQPLTVYNQNPLTRGLRDAVIDNYPGIKNVYNGFEVLVDKRFSNNSLALVSYTYGNVEGTITTSDLNNPNLLINNYGPLDFMLGAHWAVRSGFPLGPSYTFTTRQVPGLTQVSQSVKVAPRGDYRLDRLNLLDLRFSKRFKVNSMLEGYNMLNSSATTRVSETVGPNLFFIIESLTARVAKLGLRVSF